MLCLTINTFTLDRIKIQIYYINKEQQKKNYLRSNTILEMPPTPTINLNTVHASAVVRDYISQPRISKLLLFINKYIY
jgi:hypothetical protein